MCFLDLAAEERVDPPVIKLTPRRADGQKRMDLPSNFHPCMDFVSWNVSIISNIVFGFGDGLTGYLGLGKPGIAGEKRFRGLTELTWGSITAMAFRPSGLRHGM
jgi:hypothetical protein